MTVRREYGEGLRDKREARDSRDAHVRSLPVALVPPLSLLSREWHIGDCSRRAHELCGLDRAMKAHIL